MKTRIDFVSNSSSSSFICALEDNQFGILLSSFQVLDFDQYFDKFGKREVEEYQFYDKDRKMKFISDQEYAKQFATGNVGCLPEFARDSYAALDTYKKKEPPSGKYNYKDPEWKAFYDKEDALLHQVVDDCKTVLRPYWGETKFCYSEIEDNNCSDIAEIFECWSDEDLADERFVYVDSLKKLKFKRVYSNH